ncbi:Zinc finger protein 470 Chondrogenesis zinc finger protein 1 [Channa argus]|uniref:Zinc finger protein 470 Chondrogenesis zinc finger protein 1 n=1 Tax=Channa argus TaxID=215402 RepID=A0A6G1PP46_CHAAH|nr:Zinc finger protein 470 Chondrogenesis zinc finger protein 1 [Channa argus]
MHKEKPLWCLGCAKGFRDEMLLDRHLQGHSLRQQKCDICPKSFQTPTQLECHYKSHTGAKPYQCSFCRKSFSHSGKLVLHQKKHLRVYARSSRISLGIKNFAIMAKKQTIKQKSVKKEPEMEACMEVLTGKKEGVEESVSQKTCEAADSGDHVTSEESECGEPMHDIRFSKPSNSALFHASEEMKSETVRQQTRPDKSESQGVNMHREHRYWKWECFECHMGFDDVAKLHLHYIKLAIGGATFSTR